MRIDILTLFPEMFGALEHSIIKRARNRDLVSIHLHQLRDYAFDKHRMVDDVPYGGGAGMVLKPEPLFAAVRDIQAQASPKARVLLTSPHGTPLRQQGAVCLAGYPRLLIICGHYEGVDERVREALVDEELSLGDFILTGGEIPAMALVDAVVRLLPGVIDEASLEHESFNAARLEFPHYTRPRELEGMAVPEVLLSGNHARIEAWRQEQALLRTAAARPDLLEAVPPTRAEQKILTQHGITLGPSCTG